LRSRYRPCLRGLRGLFWRPCLLCHNMYPVLALLPASSLRLALPAVQPCLICCSTPASASRPSVRAVHTVPAGGRPARCPAAAPLAGLSSARFSCTALRNIRCGVRCVPCLCGRRSTGVAVGQPGGAASLQVGACTCSQGSEPVQLAQGCAFARRAQPSRWVLPVLQAAAAHAQRLGRTVGGTAGGAGAGQGPTVAAYAATLELARGLVCDHGTRVQCLQHAAESRAAVEALLSSTLPAALTAPGTCGALAQQLRNSCQDLLGKAEWWF
jgi:hypothetical protein